jgi:nanoRNase/pAp phosphatase (c-di-AMP/oligoRNAs hydrolase)
VTHEVVAGGPGVNIQRVMASKFSQLMWDPRQAPASNPTFAAATGAQRGFAVIITQFDLDALGAALGLAEVIRSVRGENNVVIFYCGAISHPLNKAAMARCMPNDSIRPIKSWRPDENRHVVLVDSSRMADTRLGIKLNEPPILVVDHHLGTDVVEDDNNFVWIEDVGSTITLVVELMTALGIKLDSISRLVPLMFALGIRADTEHLLRGVERDQLAQLLVERSVDKGELRRLFNYPLPGSYFDNLEGALKGVAQQNARLVTNIGIVSSEEGDDVSVIADLLIRRQGAVRSRGV